MFRRLMAVVGAATLLVFTGATSALGAANGTDRPFGATASGKIFYDASNPLGCDVGFTTVLNAAGQASHLGRFTLSGRHCEYYTSATSGVSVGTMTLTAANRDQVFGTYRTTWVFDGETFTVSVTGDLIVEGGTGRFTHATGTLAQDHTITVTPDQPWLLQMGFEGAISY